MRTASGHLIKPSTPLTASRTRRTTSRSRCRTQAGPGPTRIAYWTGNSQEATRGGAYFHHLVASQSKQWCHRYRVCKRARRSSHRTRARFSRIAWHRSQRLVCTVAASSANSSEHLKKKADPWQARLLRCCRDG